MTLSWVGSHELAFSKTPENLIRLAHQVFSLTALLGVGFRELTFSKTPENLIRLVHQVFSPVAFLGVGSRVLAPSMCVCVDVHSIVSDSFAIPWTVVHQAPLSIGLPRQEYWSGLPSPSPGDLPDPGIEPVSLASPASAGGSFTTRATWDAPQLTF